MGKADTQPGKDWIVRGRHNPEKDMLARTMRQEMTSQERMRWQAVRANRLGGLHFRKQQVIDGFVTDFYCHAKGLVVEVDGGVHHQRTDADRRRTDIFARPGLRVMRFSNARIETDLAACLAEIRACADGNGTQSESTPSD